MMSRQKLPGWREFRAIAAMVLCLPFMSCDTAGSGRDVYVLIDISASYFPRAVKSMHELGLIVIPMAGGDTFTLAYIQSCSFSDAAKVIDVRLADQQTPREEQQGEILNYLHNGIPKLRQTEHTDITGAIFLAAEYLKPSRSDRKALIIFSDMVQDLAPDCVRPASLEQAHLSGLTVILANVSKTSGDNEDPEAYFRRIDKWTSQLKRAGARKVYQVNNMEQVEDILEKM